MARYLLSATGVSRPPWLELELEGSGSHVSAVEKSHGEGGFPSTVAVGCHPSLRCLTNLHWLWLVYTQWLVRPCTVPLKYFEANFFKERILLTLSSLLFVLNSIKGGCCMSGSCMYKCMGIFNTVYPGSKQ